MTTPTVTWERRLEAVGVDADTIAELRPRSETHWDAAVELAKLGVPNGRLIEFTDAVVARSNAHPVTVDEAAYDLGYLSAIFGSDHDATLLTSVAEHFRRRATA